MNKSNHRISESEKMLLPIMTTDDGWDESQSSEILADIPEEKGMKDIPDIDSTFSQYTFQFEDDLLMDTEIESFNEDDILEGIDWQGHDLPHPRHKKRELQLSRESFIYFERKAAPQLALVEIADIIQDHLNLRCFAGQLYYYDGLIWKTLSDDDELRCLTGTFLEVQDMLSKKHFVEILNILRSRRNTLMDTGDKRSRNTRKD